MSPRAPAVDGGALFEYVAADRKWRERGKGEFRINTNKSGMVGAASSKGWGGERGAGGGQA